MDYHAEEELTRLLARSDELTQRSQDVNVRVMRVSAAMMRALEQGKDVCAMADRLYAKPLQAAGAGEEAEREPRHGS